MEWESVEPVITDYAIRIAGALVILVVGFWLSGRIASAVRNSKKLKDKDPTLSGFLGNITNAFVKVIVIIAVIGQLGIPTASIITVLGAAGLAIGLALQGSLSNFASGIMLVIFKPFKVGNFISAGGESGIVDEIGIFSTELHTPDNKRVILPNSQVMGGSIVNFTHYDTRRMELMVGINYDDDVELAKKVLMEVLVSDERVLKDPEPSVGLWEMGDSSINLVVRPWVKTAEYWDVFFALQEGLKKAIESNGMSIPYPQRDVHLYVKNDAQGIAPDMPKRIENTKLPE